jgi:hypothetical protein
VRSECQAQPEAWSDWGGFVDTHKQINVKPLRHIETTFKTEETAESITKVKLEMNINHFGKKREII